LKSASKPTQKPQIFVSKIIIFSFRLLYCLSIKNA
jgi:hypothetical protein